MNSCSSPLGALARRTSGGGAPLLAPVSFAGFVLLAGCSPPAGPAANPVTSGQSAPSHPPAPSPAATPPAPTVATAPVLALPAGVPDSPAGHQFAWVLAAIAQTPSAAEVASRFTPEFTAKVPAAKVVAIFAQLGGQFSTLALDRIEAGPSPYSLAAAVHTGMAQGPAGAAKMRILLRVEPTEPFRIAGLLLRPMIEAKPAGSWDEVKAGLGAVAPQVGFLAARITAGKCVPISALEPKKPLALGSAFKLYLLDALAGQIAAGKHTWDDAIVIDDARKSLPSGDLRMEPAGKVFTVRQMAEQMISASDNTAADHLLAFVGRTAVEDDVKTSGHSAPSRMVPFLSTRDVFALKLVASSDELAAYARADVPHKRKLLETYEARDLSRVPLDDNGWSKPRMIDSIEWFASPEDLCKVMASLKRYADVSATAPVAAILSMNPGMQDETGAYDYIGFKGGSEPGVTNLTWLLRRKSDARGAGSWLFLTVGFNNPSDGVDDAKAMPAAMAARDFLGK
jgi:hypothetical protein